MSTSPATRAITGGFHMTLYSLKCTGACTRPPSRYRLMVILHFRRVHFPCVFSRVMRCGFDVTVNLHVMRPAAPGFCLFLHGKRALQEGFLAAFAPKPGRRPNVDKEHCM